MPLLPGSFVVAWCRLCCCLSRRDSITNDYSDIQGMTLSRWQCYLHQRHIPTVNKLYRGMVSTESKKRQTIKCVAFLAFDALAVGGWRLLIVLLSNVLVCTFVFCSICANTRRCRNRRTCLGYDLTGHN